MRTEESLKDEMAGSTAVVVLTQGKVARGELELVTEASRYLAPDFGRCASPTDASGV